MRAEPNRLLAAAERTLVEWLLQGLPDGPRALYVDQLASLRVTHHCECGCPSIEFGSHPRTKPSVILAEAYGAAPEGVGLDVILWEDDGELTGLEFVSHNDRSDFSIPGPDLLSREPKAGAV
jgi:hypothetical protein